MLLDDKIRKYNDLKEKVLYGDMSKEECEQAIKKIGELEESLKNEGFHILDPFNKNSFIMPE